MTIEDGALELPVVVTGKDQAITDLRAVDQAASRTAQAQTQGAQATARAARDATQQYTAMGQTAQRSGVQVQQFGSTLGLIGNAIGRSNTTLGTMVSVLGQATGVLGSLSAGLGPLGIALGVATAAYGLFQAATARQTTEIRRQADTIRDQAIPAIDDYVGAIRRGISERERLQRIRSGQGSVLDTRAELERLRATRDAAVASSATPDTTREFFDAQIQAAEERLSAARTRTSAQGGTIYETPEETAERLRRDRERRSRGGRGGDRDFGAAPSASGLDAFFGTRNADGSMSYSREYLMRASGDSRSLESLMGPIQGDPRNPLGRADRTDKDESSALAHQAFAIQQGYALAADEAERLRDTTKEIGEAFSEVVAAVVDGEMSLGQAFFTVAGEKVKAKGYEMIASGVASTLEGIGLSILAPLSPQGPALIGVGAAQIAQGSAYVAGGYLAVKAGQSMGSSGGGGGSGGSRRGAEPARLPSGDRGSSGPVTVINNFNSPMTEAEVARTQSRTMRAAARTSSGYIRAR